MSGQPDISSILAALAAQQPAGGAPQGQSQPGQPIRSPQPGPPGYSMPNTAGVAPGGYGLPAPTNSGSLDLSAIKPVSSGSVSIADAIAKARGIAAEKGVAYDTGRSSANDRSYNQRSRSRSRTPPRQNFRDNHNPYRDERRGGPDRGGDRGDRRDPYSRRDRSRSPPGRGRENFSPPGRHGGHRERDDARMDDSSEVIVIESSLVGLVIGRQGENMRRIESETGARIQFLTGPESAGPRRQCRISGTLRQRQDAKREIDRIIDESPQGGKTRDFGSARDVGRQQPHVSKGLPQPLREGEQSIQIMVPDRTVGLIIGRGGETIRDLQDRSGCHVNILGEDKSVNGLRPVNLIGSAQASQKAQDLIMEIVDSDTRNLSQGGQPGQAPRDAGRMPNDHHDSAGKSNETIRIPSEAVGMVIGKGGETIKEMQNTTGCKINVTQPSGADIEREIGLVGAPQAIEAAKSAIWDKVDAVREKNGGGGRRGGRPSGDQYDAYSQQQQPQQQQPYDQSAGGYMMPQQQQGAAAGVPGVDPANDPYAAWGGVQNYYQMFYAYQAQAAQAGQLPGQAPPDQGNPPGAA